MSSSDIYYIYAVLIYEQWTHLGAKMRTHHRVHCLMTITFSRWSVYYLSSFNSPMLCVHLARVNRLYKYAAVPYEKYGTPSTA